MLRERVERIAEKYADLVEKKLDESLQKGPISATEFEEIKDGIRMLNHVMSAKTSRRIEFGRYVWCRGRNQKREVK